MRRQRCAIPESDAAAWQALGWRVLHSVPMGIRGQGPHVLIEWEGEGDPPTPQGTAMDGDNKPEILVLVADPDGRYVPVFVEVWHFDPTDGVRLQGRKGMAPRTELCPTREKAIGAAMGFRG